MPTLAAGPFGVRLADANAAVDLPDGGFTLVYDWVKLQVHLVRGEQQKTIAFSDIPRLIGHRSSSASTKLGKKSSNAMRIALAHAARPLWTLSAETGILRDLLHDRNGCGISANTLRSAITGINNATSAVVGEPLLATRQESLVERAAGLLGATVYVRTGVVRRSHIKPQLVDFAGQGLEADLKAAGWWPPAEDTNSLP